MKILCIIDHFGSGGAQRQMVNLACGLKQRGHDVEIFIYFPEYDFFKSDVTQAGVPIHEYRKDSGSSLGVVHRLIRIINGGKFETVISFLNSPNVYAEIASFFTGSATYIVGERSSHHNDSSKIGAFVRRNLHRLSDCVVANSVSHKEWLENKHGWLRTKCVAIYNGLDTSLYRSEPPVPVHKKLKLIAIGRVGPEKNLLNLIKGLDFFFHKHEWLPSISWVGRREVSTREGKEYAEKVDHLLDSLPHVKRSWNWLGERSDIPFLLSTHDALVLPSFYEGLPNVICEALASGRPVLASQVCDNEILVPDGVRGFLFNPYDPQTIAEAVERISDLSPRNWTKMSKNASEFAENCLLIEKMVMSYENLILWLLNHRKAL